jgi:ribonuclease G
MVFRFIVLNSSFPVFLINKRIDVNNELVIDASSNEIAIALLEDKRLIELNKEKTDTQFSVGDVYLGRVKKIMPGLNAAFVDVGYEKDAFLHYLDLGPQFNSLNKYMNLAISRKGKVMPLSKFRRESDINKDGKISEVVKSGQQIIVQVAKEPISTKGPRLGSEISIPGRNLVLMPFHDKVSVSSKIESNEEKERLKSLLLSIKPKNYGVIVRTAAEGKKVAELDSELRGLVDKWEAAFDKIKGGKAPKLILGEVNRTSAILRDILSVKFENITVNDAAAYHDIKQFIQEIAPEKTKIVKLYEGDQHIFEKFNIEKQIKSLFGKTVSFKSGAYLIIEHTEALHVIDVNSGNRSKSDSDQESNALDVNLAAGEEIARQLRLRDMGGIIVVDFIDMQTNEHKQMLYEKMKEIMSRDRTKNHILPLSKFGLMQITRQRVRPEMHIDTQETCPSCLGTGKVESTILYTETIRHTLKRVISDYKLKALTLQTHPFIAAYVNKGILNSVRKQWSKEFKCQITVKPTISCNLMEFKIFDRNGDEVLFTD